MCDADRDSVTELNRRRRWPWIVIAIVAVVVAGAASTWAVITVLRPAEDPLESAAQTYVAVAPGEVGAAMNLNTTAEWTPVPVGANRAMGVVTGVSVGPGDEVTHGTTLYSVDLHPVVVAQGSVPAFRSVTSGVEGPDVAQVQAMLTALGHYDGPIDGDAGAGTERAIKRWQEAIGVEETGVVAAGDIIFVPTLPTRVSLDDTLVRRGVSLTGGEEVLRGLPAQPDFRLPVTEAQAGMIPTDTRVELTSPEGATWSGFTSEIVNDTESSGIWLTLVGAEGSLICADQCGQIPPTGPASLPSRIVTTETVAGLVVPSSALVTGANGETAVINEQGERIIVSVEASAKGMSVITGVDEGIMVRVPAKESSGT